MPVFIDRTGQKFGRLTVIERVYLPGKKRAWWLCRCDCGNEKIVSSDSMVQKCVQSCGCLQKERIRKRHGYTTHSGASRLYHTWSGMIQRCTNKNDKYYYNYGGRGIKVCDDWKKDFVSFKDWALENGYSEDLFIDRIDNDKGYFPDNCRWATRRQQQNNLRCNVKYQFADGRILTNSDMCKILSVSKNTVDNRIKSHIVSIANINYASKGKRPHLFILDCKPEDIACDMAFLCELEKGRWDKCQS